MLCKEIVSDVFFVHNMFSPSSAKRRASDKDLPVCSSGGAQWRHLAAVPATSNAQIEVKFTRHRAPDYGHQLRQKAFVLSRRVLRTYYVVSDPQINFAKPAEN